MAVEKTLGIIHASHITIDAMKPYIQKYLDGITIMHLCDDTIQRDNLSAEVGTIPKVNYYKFAQYAHNLEEANVDAILLACSTFNYAAELARPLINTPILQIDRPMMEKAVQTGKKIGLLATLPSTVPSSRRLLEIAASEAKKEITIEVSLQSEAFAEYSKGNIGRHNQMLLESVNQLSNKVDCIVMAQLSMSALAPYLGNTKVPVYNSGDTGFQKVREFFLK
jgi:aspartate/glutamate racemase